MNVLQEIRKEHEEVKDMMSRIEKLKGDPKKKLFQELYATVKGHHESEERVLFSDIKKESSEEGKEIVREMIEEHSLLSYQFSVIEKTGIGNDTWDAKFNVLKEVLEHHIDEEEKDLFKQAKKVLSEKILKDKYDDFEKTMKEYKKEQEEKLKRK